MKRKTLIFLIVLVACGMAAQSMPLLKGKSSHGSKPMTSLSFTFSWMPHCCPQKQQCVLTSRSGSTEESTIRQLQRAATVVAEPDWVLLPHAAYALDALFSIGNAHS